MSCRPRAYFVEAFGMRPETKDALSGDVNIAYQVIGDGPVDVVYVPGFLSHLEYAWDDPNTVRLLEGLASFSRLICFDKRGTGLSDRTARRSTSRGASRQLLNK